MAADTSNPYLAAQKSSDSGLQVALHPLVLLTISDYITRHTLRNLKGQIVGGLLGQQNGREITIEHAFECATQEVDGEMIVDPTWFEARLQQMKDVHKAPLLDLVGWYTLMPPSGPQAVHLPLHQRFLDVYNESSILLGFHPTAVLEGSVGGKLPLTIYESNYEADDTGMESGEDSVMKEGDAQLKLKFKELPYTVETGEAEMISIDFVARGGGNATAVESAKPKPKKDEQANKGKAKAKATKTEEQNVLSNEDEELIASLTAKANAIKMLHSRIKLIAAYLQNLPPSSISDPSDAMDSDAKKYTQVDQSILRSIQALLSRLSLLIPSNTASFAKELVSEQNDVNLVSLLSNLTESIKDVRETGKKFAVVDSGRQSKKGGLAGPGSWESGSFGGSNGSMLGVGDLMG